VAEKVTLKQKYSRAEFRKQAAEILLKLSTEVGGFADASEEAKAKRRTRSLEDPFYFFRTYLPHYFSEECAPFHYALVELLDRRPDPQQGEVLIPVVVAAPREFAKTTLTSFGYSLHQICHQLRHFIVIASDTEDLASDLTGYLYLELLYNERLKADFGEMVRDNWAVDDFVTANDIRLKARGRGQRLRGLKHKQYRPDLVILDDMENDKGVKNPRLVKELLDWIKSTVYPAIDSGGNLFWIGTILARRSALDIALRAEEEPWTHWTRRIYRAIQEDGTPLWPARHPIAKLLKQKEIMGSLAFNREKMNSPVDEEGMFREEWIRYFHLPELAGVQLVVVGYFDPSVESGASSDYKAIITVGLDVKEMLFYVLDAFIRRGLHRPGHRRGLRQAPGVRLPGVRGGGQRLSEAAAAGIRPGRQGPPAISAPEGGDQHPVQRDPGERPVAPGGAGPHPVLPGPGRPGPAGGAAAVLSQPHGERRWP